MKSTDIFPDPQEHADVRRVLDSVNGTITRVTAPDGRVIFERNSYEQIQKIKHTNHARTA